MTQKFLDLSTSILEIALLQSDLHSFVEWCENNGLRCNPSKCSVIRFGRSSLPFIDYMMEGKVLQRVDHVRDLGVIFDSKMSFKQHIDYLDVKVRKIIFFIKRFSGKFKSVSTFRSLYFSFVYSRLMYASVVWRPSEKGLIKKLEALNTLFLRYAAYRTGNPLHYTDHDFSQTYKTFSIATLESARDRADLIFIFKLLNGFVDCPELLGSCNFYCPPRSLRSGYFFDNPTIKPGKEQTIIARVTDLCNVNFNWFDMYLFSLYQVKDKSRILFKFETV